jgi:hypothetical protein
VKTAREPPFGGRRSELPLKLSQLFKGDLCCFALVLLRNTRACALIFFDPASLGAAIKKSKQNLKSEEGEIIASSAV